MCSYYFDSHWLHMHHICRLNYCCMRASPVSTISKDQDLWQRNQNETQVWYHPLSELRDNYKVKQIKTDTTLCLILLWSRGTSVSQCSCTSFNPCVAFSWGSKRAADLETSGCTYIESIFTVLHWCHLSLRNVNRCVYLYFWAKVLLPYNYSG